MTISSTQLLLLLGVGSSEILIEGVSHFNYNPAGYQPYPPPPPPAYPAYQPPARNRPYYPNYPQPFGPMPQPQPYNTGARHQCDPSQTFNLVSILSNTVQAVKTARDILGTRLRSLTPGEIVNDVAGLSQAFHTALMYAGQVSQMARNIDVQCVVQNNVRSAVGASAAGVARCQQNIAMLLTEFAANPLMALEGSGSRVYNELTQDLETTIVSLSSLVAASRDQGGSPDSSSTGNTGFSGFKDPSSGSGFAANPAPQGNGGFGSFMSQSNMLAAVPVSRAEGIHLELKGTPAPSPLNVFDLMQRPNATENPGRKRDASSETGLAETTLSTRLPRTTSPTEFPSLKHPNAESTITAIQRDFSGDPNDGGYTGGDSDPDFLTVSPVLGGDFFTETYGPFRPKTISIVQHALSSKTC